MPMIGRSGKAWRICHTQRTATGRIAGPDRPPVMPARCGRIVSGLITMPSSVLMTETPVAPARTTAPAIETMSVTSGESFAKIGMRGSLWRLTAWMTSAADPASHANTWPRFSTFGHEMLTSMAGHARARCAAGPRAWRTRRRCRPAIDTIVRAPRSAEPREVVLDEPVDARAPAGRSS